MFSFQLPLQKGLDLFPQAMQAPPVTRIIVEYPALPVDTDYPKWQAQRQAMEMIRPLIGQLRGFIQGQRRIHSLGVIDYSWKRAVYPGIVVNWRSMAGQETIEIRVRPTPPLKKEEGLMLLILHNGNKVTAVPMKTFPGLKKMEPFHQATLGNSSWGSEIIRASQYKFAPGSHSVVLSGLKIVSNVLSRAGNHHITHTLSRLRHFVETDAEATDAPIINGDGTTFYTPFGVYEMESTSDGLRLVSSGDAYQSIPAYAISATGTYYYAPGLRAFRLAANPVNPREAMIQEPYYTYDQYAAFVAANNFGGFAVTFPYMTADEIDAFEGTFDGTGTFYEDAAGYRGAASPTNSATFNNGVIVTSRGDLPSGTTIDSDVSTMFPLSVYSRDTVQNIDRVEVNLVALTASHTRWINPSNTSEFTNVANAELLSRSLSVNSSNTLYTADTGSPFARFWYVSHPPCLSTGTGGFYLGESEHIFPSSTEAATLRTPFGNYGIDADPNIVYRWGMFDKYKPWLHISNGGHYIQGFELDGTRRLFSAGQDITTLIEDLTGTGIANVQMLLMDIPLDRIKEFT